MMGVSWIRFTLDDNFTTQEKRTLYLVKNIVQLNLIANDEFYGDIAIAA